MLNNWVAELRQLNLDSLTATQTRLSRQNHGGLWSPRVGFRCSSGLGSRVLKTEGVATTTNTMVPYSQYSRSILYLKYALCNDIRRLLGPYILDSPIK